MLEIGNKTITVDGVTVFSDHADPNQFWYLPGPVQLARRANDNRAAFTLIKYGNVSGDTIEGKGFLMVEVNLKLDLNVERKIMSKISSMAKGTPRLAAVPFDEGTVECIALDLQGGGGTTAEVSAEGTFQAVESILGGTVPSLHGDNNAAFSLSLSQEGTTILEGVFKEKGTPIGAVYNLKYSGLRPALEVEIKANMKRVYDHFSAGLEAQVYFVRAGIDAGFEKLVEDKVIEINVINYSTEDDRTTKEDWALNFFKENLLNDWFRPTLTPGQMAGGMAQAENLTAVQNRVQAMRPPDPPSPPPVPTPPTAPAAGGTATPTPPATPRPDQNSGAPENPGVIPNPPVVAANSANAAETATAMPPQPAQTTPAQNAGVRAPTAPNAANVADTALVSFKLKMIKQIEEKTLTFKFTRSEAVQRTYAPQGFFGLFAEDLSKDGHFFSIDGDDVFFREFRVSVETPFDKERIGLSSAHVQLNYGKEGDPDKKHKDFVIDKDSPEKTDWLVKTIPGVNKYSYSVQYHFDPDSDWKGDKMSYEFDAKMTEDRTLLLHPFDSLVFLDIIASASQVDWEEVADVELHLSYKSGDGWTEKSTLFFAENNAEDQHWKIRSSDTENKAITYFNIYRMKDGSVRQTDPATTEATRILISNPLKAIDIEFIPLYAPGSVKTIFIDVEYDDMENALQVKERIKMDGALNTSVNFALHVIDDTKGGYRYQTTVLGNDNTLKRKEKVETNETLIGVEL
jgi:hypothetical protein